MGPENKHGGHVDKDYGRRQGVCTHMSCTLYSWTQGDNLQTLPRKSEDYYSESPGDTFSSGRFQIRTLSLKYHVDYEVRVLEVVQVRKGCSRSGLSNLADDLIFYLHNMCSPHIQTSHPSKSRTLDHYLFTGWPDYGVPKYPTSLIRMLYHVRDARVSDVPILVHCRCMSLSFSNFQTILLLGLYPHNSQFLCSAGVGRTGTFIALDITLDQMKTEKTVDVKGTVEKMRERRMNMVQTAVCVAHAVVRFG